MKAFVIYHSADLDGHCSGAICALSNDRLAEVHLIGWDFGQPYPELKLDKHTVVIVTDLSFPEELMLKWREEAGGLLWIDHHFTAIERLEKHGFAGLRNVKHSACELAWHFFHPEEPIPEFVRLLGRYDVFDQSLGVEWAENVWPFQLYMRAVETSPGLCGEIGGRPIGIDFWKWAFSEMTETFMHDAKDVGRKIANYQAKIDAEIAAMSAFEITFQGLPAICMTRARGGSQAFNSVYRHDKHKLMIAAYFKGKDWSYSLYSDHDDVNCGAICAKFGGGGHKGAAGFRSNEFLLT